VGGGGGLSNNNLATGEREKCLGGVPESGGDFAQLQPVNKQYKISLKIYKMG
jgi:hypothetical protein